MVCVSLAELRLVLRQTLLFILMVISKCIRLWRMGFLVEISSVQLLHLLARKVSGQSGGRGRS